ncbi:TetR family transcriptional regulator [Devosia sp. Root685]|uniref:TetR/AcrR family transcriptional regulator n=1 Tax=Devosia sp. Root685 TaxID=1736587 RepID=UPI0006F2FAF7|nr:TetR-like C-terminal domain-containing protein [Devosia sp. Root685]KRA96793.1 TetR family transcriptional regulator [Devosia sp. Root685]
MPRAGLSREKLIEAGAVLADSEGFAALTLAALARQFGVKLASLYAHVRNSDDLKAGVALRALDALADEADEAVAGRAGKEAVVALAEVHRRFAGDHPGLFEAARFPLSPEQAAGSGGVRLARTMLAALRDYGLSEADQVHAVRLLGSFFLGFSLLERGGSFSHSQPEPDLSWQCGLDALDLTLKSWMKK